MTNTKKKSLIIFFAITIPIVYMANKIIIYLIPAEYKLADGALKGEAFYWFAKWSAPLSMVIAFIIFGVIYRIFITNKNKEDK